MTEGGSGSGFSWGLTPGGAEEHTEPQALPPAPAAVPAPAPAAAPPPEPAPTGSALDTLFGESRFQEYDDRLELAPAPRSRPRGARVAAPADRVSRTQRRVIAVAGCVVAALALVALFVVGTRLPHLLQATAVADATRTPAATRSATPTPTVLAAAATAAGPAAVGTRAWTELRGGECLGAYAGPWAETFDVVDCAGAHPAQLVFRGTFDPAATPAFPGVEALQARIPLLCAAPGVLDLGAATAYADLQVQGSYPVTDAQWDAGAHDYSCFVSRSSGQPLTGSIAAPTPAR